MLSVAVMVTSPNLISGVLRSFLCGFFKNVIHKLCQASSNYELENIDFAQTLSHEEKMNSRGHEWTSTASR